MDVLENKSNLKIPEPALRRLPWYLAFLKLMRKNGETLVSSTQIAKEINVDASQVAKDLSYVNVSGKTRVGYDIDSLIKVLERFLGFTVNHRAFLFGVGSLGAALLHDFGLKQYGLEIIAGFDVNPEICDTSINNIPIYHVSEFPEVQKKLKASVCILTVPIDKAQEIADLAVEKGIKAIWNFTPFRVRMPDRIVVQNTSIYAHLAVMFNRMNSNSL